jgi:LuxR family maltose regulon positive regulatory protein
VTGHHTAEALPAVLRAPASTTRLVSRDRLIERLDRAPPGGLILVSAPAGSGKTTLVADWIRRRERPAAWVTLGAGDNDPARFWRSVAAATERASPQLPLPPRGGPAPEHAPDASGAILDSLAAADDRLVVVVDDYHVIDSAVVHASLQWFVDHLPPAVRLVLTTRADPPLPLGRLRAHGRMTELRGGDLRFTVDEAAALLTAGVGEDLPRSTVETLAERTEGWAVGLQLAALALRGRDDAARFVDAFTGSHRYVLDYLTEEVLDRQTPELRGFLLETSVARQVCGPLCDAMTGRADSQDLLEAAERANLFLVALDSHRGWWRYHGLFADLLQSRLVRERAERIPDLHRRASAWFAERGDVDDAVHHALAADDAATAADVITRHFDALLRRNEDATVRRWLDALPQHVFDERPRLHLAQGFLAVHGGDVTAVERAIAAVDGTDVTTDAAAGMLADPQAVITVQRAAVAHLRGDADTTRRLARKALAEHVDAHWMLRSIAQWHRAVGEWLSGDLVEAEYAFGAWADGWRHGEDSGVPAWGHWYLGRVQHARGHLTAARQTYQRALTLARDDDGRLLPTAGPALIGTAEIHYELGDLDAARAQVIDGLAHCRRLAYGPPLAAGYGLLARICHAAGDANEADDALRRADATALAHTAVGLLNTTPATRARITLARGDPVEIARLVMSVDHTLPGEVTYAREADHLTLVRLLLHGDAAERAHELLERLRAAAVAQGRVTSLVQIEALRARALADMGYTDRALAALRGALACGTPERFVRTFVDEGAELASLLGRLIADTGAMRELSDAAIPLAYVERLLTAFGDAGRPVTGRPVEATMAALVAPLTDRELDVLALVNAGHTNKAIAAELVISLETVKRHVTHILDKLGAANRTQAAARARALGLLDAHG